MKFLFRSFPIAIFTFLLGTLGVTFVAYLAFIPVVPEMPQKFEVYLETIEVKDSDSGRWSMNGGYLAMFDAVFFDKNNIVALYFEDGIRISHDGGKTWQRMFEPSGVPQATGGYRLQSFEFLNSKIGWASGSCLVSTRDGGLTWQNIKLPEWMDNIKVKFLNEKFGYAAGRAGFCNRDRNRCNTSLTVYKTTDGGKSWRKSYSDKKQSTPWQIQILDENVALVLGNGNNVLRTEDGGRSWKTVYDRDYGGAKSIATSPDGRLWIFGNKNIIISDDIGRTWSSADNIDETIVNHDWWSVDFNKDCLGVAVSEDAAIAVTHDGGQSWKQVLSNLQVNGKIPVPNNPFDEALRGIRLSGNKGIIMGGQRDYLINIPE